MFEDGNHLVLFPSVAYRDGELNSWIANVHGWCFDAEHEVDFQRATAGILRRALKLPRDADDPPFFRERSWGFVVKSRKKVSIEISHPQGSFIFQKSKGNGHFRGILDLQLEDGSDSTSRTAHGSLKTTISARRENDTRQVCGDIHLVGDRGLSVISDIDDTIKFTNVDNKQEMLRNSFLRPYQSIEGMADLFTELATPETSFHYISATPWQLYHPIARFLSNHHFPEGSIHLRKFELKDITFLKKIFPTYKKKRKVIESLLAHYPERRFLLFGDSGESDPEMYGKIYRKHPEQIAGICIRNTKGESSSLTRYQRAFHQVPANRWHLFEHAGSLQDDVLPKLLEETGREK